MTEEIKNKIREALTKVKIEKKFADAFAKDFKAMVNTDSIYSNLEDDLKEGYSIDPCEKYWEYIKESLDDYELPQDNVGDAIDNYLKETIGEEYENEDFDEVFDFINQEIYTREEWEDMYMEAWENNDNINNTVNKDCKYAEEEASEAIEESKAYNKDPYKYNGVRRKDFF